MKHKNIHDNRSIIIATKNNEERGIRRHPLSWTLRKRLAGAKSEDDVGVAPPNSELLVS